MTRIEQIETFIASLPEDEYVQVRRWFLDRDWEKWDREVEADAAAGKLDFLLREAAEAKQTGRLKDL